MLNDDLVQPLRGFGTHPHRDMEICTYIVSGELTHQDSLGSKETLPRGGVQYMSAGTGVRHSEMNAHSSLPVRFIQMWILPRQRMLPPRYGGATFEPRLRQNRWCHVAADVAGPTLVANPGDHDTTGSPIRLHQDVNILVTEATKSITLTVRPGRQLYLVCLEGQAHISVSVPCNDQPGPPPPPAGSSLLVREQDAVEVIVADGTAPNATLTVDPQILDLGDARGSTGPAPYAHVLAIEMAAERKS